MLADCGPCVPVGVVKEDFAVILVKNATMGGNAKHHLPIAWKSSAPAEAPAAKLAMATPIRRNRDLITEGERSRQRTETTATTIP